jgi:hypothetical protein
MRMPSSRDLFLALSAAAASACTLAPGDPQPVAQALTTCVVPTSGVVELKASARGLVVASGSGTDVAVQRLEGTGCDLAASGPLMVAESLLDVDDLGNLYVFPSDQAGRCLRSTMPAGERRGIVAVVGENEAPRKLLDAGRGIWTFGVSPSGDALWVTACGPNGIFAIGADGVTEAMAAPDTLWEQRPAVLTDARTFWSVGDVACSRTEPLASCGLSLVRATPEGSEPFGSIVADHGDGPVEAELARCGSSVCGVYPRAVTVWNEWGAEELTITLEDVGATEVERFAAATGNDAGIYVLLTGGLDSRVVFVAGAAAHAR